MLPKTLSQGDYLMTRRFRSNLWISMETFGAKYHDRYTNYQGQGVDQLQNIISEIKQNPHSRRLILNSWNASDIDKMALPPCHVMVQFYINDGYLDAQLYQRSGDAFLGVPFNIASYSF